MSSMTVMKLSAKLGHLHKTYRLRRVKSGIIASMKMQLLCCEQKQDKGEHTKLRRVKVYVSGLFYAGCRVYEDIYDKSEKNSIKNFDTSLVFVC